MWVPERTTSANEDFVFFIPLPQARFQERQSEEREQKMAEMLERQHAGVGKSATFRNARPTGSSSSANSIASSISEISSMEESIRVGGRVRQMFEERRKNGGQF
jgi:hypothetical protein